ncbi:unnamed protein product [Acanthocheilonema viteae]|uniref:CBM21 domain-containing protein n=1 Tax=Acanthocheilonema viteae TaxID=6277 RepID=A0A498SLC9_ACAVI|nr:unnamed protein product [Acanthocheilonema viteae]
MNSIMDGKKMAMDLSTATIDVAQHSDRSTLQSFIKKIKNHNLFEVKLKIDTSPTDETDKIIWTLDIPDESPPPSSTNLFKCLRNSDTDFLPDDNAQFTIVKSNSLSRSKSLRPALRTPSTHTLRMRKTVHFADSFGLDLVHQNYYEADDLSIELQKFGATYPSLFTKIIKSSRNVMLSFVKFQQRTDMEINYLTRIQSVCLQHVKFVDMNIIGTINVLNISYEKQIGATCEFCIRYMVNGIMYWDNSQGNNYIVQAVEKIATKMKPIANLFKSTDNAHS